MYDDEKDIQENVIETGATYLSSLTSISIDYGFVKIETKAFSDLPNLKFVHLKGGVKTMISSISAGAFFNLPELAEIILMGHNIRVFENNTFIKLPS